MDYAIRLLDGRRIGNLEATNRYAKNMIIELKAKNVDRGFIFHVVKNVFKDNLSDEKINKLMKDIESK